MKPETEYPLVAARHRGPASLAAYLLVIGCLHAQEPNKTGDIHPPKDKFPVKMEVTATKPDTEGKQ